jgi:hypothetical protein
MGPKVGLDTVAKRKIPTAAKNKLQFSGHSLHSLIAIQSELHGSHLMVTMTKIIGEI